MKIRNGFVSNSSSSSFVLVTTTENWERVKKELHPFEVKVAESILGKERTFLGQEVVSFSTWCTEGGSWAEYAYIDDWREYLEDVKDSFYSKSSSGACIAAWEVVQKKFCENEEQVLINEVDY